MNKTIRIVLYVLSILTVVGVIAAAILTGGQAQPVITSGTAVTEEKQSDTADKRMKTEQHQMEQIMTIHRAKRKT